MPNLVWNQLKLRSTWQFKFCHNLILNIFRHQQIVGDKYDYLSLPGVPNSLRFLIKNGSSYAISSIILEKFPLYLDPIIFSLLLNARALSAKKYHCHNTV